MPIFDEARKVNENMGWQNQYANIWSSVTVNQTIGKILIDLKLTLKTSAESKSKVKLKWKEMSTPFLQWGGLLTIKLWKAIKKNNGYQSDINNNETQNFLTIIKV